MVDAAPPQIFQPGHPGKRRRVAVGVAQIQVLQPCAAQQRGIVPHRGDKQLQIGQLFQPGQRGQILYIGIRQNQIAKIFHIPGPGAVPNPAVAQVDALHIGAVFQLVGIPAADKLVLGDGSEPGVVRSGGQGAQLDPPHKPDFRMALAKAGHGGAGNAAVTENQPLQPGKIGQQLLDVPGALQRYAGQIQLPDIRPEADVPQALLP